MSSGRTPSFVRKKVNKSECGPTSCGVRQMVIAQLHHSVATKEREYSAAEATEIFLWNLWRYKTMQFTALHSGLTMHLSNILEDETKNAGGT